MGIQDRDYWHEKDLVKSASSDSRDYSQRLRDMEAAGQTIHIERSVPPRGSFLVAIALVSVLIGGIGYLIYKFVKVFG